jgi:uncharacterized membrane protein (DUF373 family)
MSEIRFDIEFAGELTPGTDPKTARAQVQGLFKLSDASVAQLFSGTAMTIKRGVTGATAARLYAAFAQAGAVTRVIPVSGGQDEAQGKNGRCAPAVPLPAMGPFKESAPQRHASRGERWFHRFEQGLALALLVLISLVAVIAVIELWITLLRDLMTADSILPLDLSELFGIFGMFLVVLIAVELMASIHMYMMDKSIHVEIMLLIAITALARKVVVLDLEGKGNPGMYMLGLAALLSALIGGFYLVKRIDKSQAAQGASP